MRTAGSIHKTCFALLPIASNPLAGSVAGDGEPPGRFPETATLLPGVDDLQAKVHFALLVGELVSFGESESQQGGIPPFMAVFVNLRIGGMPHSFKNSSNAPKSGLGGGSPSLGAFTWTG